MAGSLFDFNAHPSLGRQVVEEGLHAASRPLDAAALPVAIDTRPQLLDAHGQPIGIGEYCKLITPSWRWDWRHLRRIDRELDRVTRGEIKRLIVQLPPRHGKSEKGTVRYPLYRIELDPALRVIVGAYNSKLARKFSRKIRRLARGRLEFADDRKAAEEWETAQGGGLRAVGVGEGVTGHGGDLIVVDDPVKSREEAESIAFREKVWEWYTDDLYTRLEPGAAMIITMTRWHEDDLVGRILASEDAANWTVIELPALAEADDPLGRAEGEALCPDRYDEADLARIRNVMGERSFAALYQQKPAPAEGLIFKSAWLRYYTTPDQPIRNADGTMVPPLPPVMSSLLQSWDMTFKEKSSARPTRLSGASSGQAQGDTDFVAGHVWSRLGANCYLRDRVHDRMDFPKTIAAVVALTTKWPAATLKLVEDKANGPAVIATLRTKVPGLVAIEPQGDKVSRAHSVTPMFEAGQVWLPHPQIAPWVKGFVLELTRFPFGAKDDDVDAAVQALRRLQQQITTGLSESGVPHSVAKSEAVAVAGQQF